jgi:Tfp pilus assembly protein PilF
MTPLGLFRRKKEETETTMQAEPGAMLDELCGGNKELHEALSRTLLLNPEKMVKEGTDFHIAKAEEYEKAGKTTNARIEYQIAGQVALHDGKLPLVQKYFKKALDIEPDSQYKKAFEYFAKKENAERAIAAAREFYAKTGKPV